MNENLRDKRGVVFSLLIASFLASFLGSAINIAIPIIGKEFKLDNVALTWLNTSFQLSSATFLLFFGKLADIKGRSKLYYLGISVFAVGVFLSIFSRNYLLLLFSRIVQGIGSSVIFATSSAILTSLYPEKRGYILGIYTTSVYLGLSFGPVLGEFLTQYVGWKSIFIFTFILSFLSIILGISYRFDEVRSEEKLDLLGGFLFSLFVFLILFGTSQILKFTGIVSVGIGLVTLLGFYFVERRVSNPILDMNLLMNNKTFTFANATALINYASTFGVSFLLSLYLQNIKGVSPRDAGLFLVFQPLTQALFSAWAGRLSDRRRPEILASIGMFIISSSLFLLSRIDTESSIFLIPLYGIFLGFGFALFSAPNTNIIMSSIDRRYYGFASSFLATMRIMGQSLSMVMIGIVFSLESSFMNSYRILMLTYGILCILGVFLSIKRHEVHKLS